MRRVTGRAARCGVLCLLVAWTGSGAGAEDVPQPPRTSQQIMAALVANEEAAAEHKHHYSYLSEERSDRTGGHLWTEKVVETNLGNVTMRLAEDGKPLSAERVAQERGRLAGIVADPAGFARRSQSQKDDEVHARQMLLLVQRAFLFSEVREEPGYLRIDFRPNPAYSTQSLEERVLHGMSGTMLIDPQRLRLHSIEARLPQDVNIGYGLLATVHTGSSLTGVRVGMDDPDWKLTLYDTHINGKVLCFKSIGRNAHAEHSHFVRVANDLTVAQAVALVEQ